MLEAMAMAGLMVLTPAFTAEVIDYDEKLTGQRREGAYASAWILLDQVVNGLAAAMLPAILLLGRSQADPQGPLGVRIIGPLGGVLLLIAFGIFLHYPLRHWSARK
jgi:GPH family glycoside/pentoside/hexuronide:cation symporter